MALLPLNPGLYPVCYDLSDAITPSTQILGGEVGTLTLRSRTNTSSEKGAADAIDGYSMATPGTRPAATLATTASQFPLFLLDDGIAKYTTMFGSVVGGSAGLVVSGSAVGPHTSAASGKVTCWDKPGQYSITTDALASDFVSGLVASTAGLSPGASLGFNASSRLAYTGLSGAVAASGVAHFVEFASAPSLVTTPAHLVGASQVFDRIVVHFHAGLGVRTL